MGNAVREEDEEGQRGRSGVKRGRKGGMGEVSYGTR